MFSRMGPIFIYSSSYEEEVVELTKVVETTKAR